MAKNPLEMLHTGAKDIPELSGDAALPLLNSRGEVSKIVRKFASDVINNGFSGEMTKDQFLKWAERRSKNLNYLFLGEWTEESDGFRRGVWNKPENLGSSLLVRMNLSGECRTAVQLFFMSLAAEVMRVMQENNDANKVKPVLDTMCNQAVNMLMGVEEGTFKTD